MSRTIPILTRGQLVLASAVMFSAAACNTENFATNRQRPDGPVTSMADPEGVAVPDLQVTDAREVDIVEGVLAHRAQYRRMLETLRDYYAEHGYSVKQKWAEAELADLSRVKPYRYILSAEVPASQLRPTRSIAEADALYQRGLDLMREGGHGIPVLYNRQKMREALDTFTSLIRKYPDSDKIDDAAFCNGEILKEYFKNTETLAVKWYERCRQWDPNSPHPALFQAAVVYDYRLKDRARALELYHRVLSEEAGDKSNAAFASRRIYELTEGVAQLHEPRQPLNPSTFAAPNTPPSGQALVGEEAPAEQAPQAQARPAASEKRPADMVPVADLGPDGDN